MKSMSYESRKEYIHRMGHRYKRASKRYKTRLIDEVCQVCGYERKYAIKLLGGKIRRSAKQRGRKSYYANPEFLAALKTIWHQTGRLFGKRLQQALPIWLRDYSKHYSALSAPIRSKLLDISPATIDRLLASERSRYRRYRNSATKPGSTLKNQIPVRIDNQDIQQPGYLEADTVAHCGGSMSGNFIWSITYTDIVTG